MLAASREKYSKKDYEKLSESIENLALVWKLTKSQWNEVEKNLAIGVVKLEMEFPLMSLLKIILED